jgi:hypothetical protein
MTLIIQIGDIRRVQGRGVTLGGINPAYDSLTEGQIRIAVGDRVAVETIRGQLLECSVLDVTTSSSLVGQKNVFLLLPEAVDEREFGIGSRVLAADAHAQSSPPGR